jgi:hypothetical protein
MIPSPSSPDIEATTLARRREIVGMLPKKMVEEMCDQEHRPSWRSRAENIAGVVASWDDHEAEILRYLDRAFDGELVIR